MKGGLSIAIPKRTQEDDSGRTGGAGEEDSFSLCGTQLDESGPALI